MGKSAIVPLEPQTRRQHWEAKVVSIEDPARLMRAQVRIFYLFEGAEDDSLPWATYLLPVGAGPNEGDFRPAKPGDLVWVDFPYNTHGRPDTRRPRIVGGLHYCPEEVPNLPHEAWLGPDVLQHKRTEAQPVPAEPEYHVSRVFTQHGITVEWEASGVYRVTHRASGTAFELTEDGHSVLHSEGDAYFSSQGQSLHEAGAGLTINVTQGDAAINVQAGSAALTAAKDLSLSAENITLKASKNLLLDGAVVTLKSAKNAAVEAGQNFLVKAAKFMETLG